MNTRKRLYACEDAQIQLSGSRQFRLVTLGQAAGKQQKGDRVWVVSDGDSLIPSQAAEHEQPVFGDVV